MAHIQKIIVFTLTFFAYVGLHCMREGWSYSKSELQQQFHLQQYQLGFTDTLYLFSYSIGMATLGNLSSKFNLKYYVSVGMILASIFYSSFAIVYVVTNKFSYIFVCIMMCMNGLAQSTGWPGILAAMGNWFGKSNRGLLMGIWGINANIGNIIGLVLCNIIEEDEHWSWPSNFLFTGGIAFFFGVIILLFLQEKPRQNMQIETEEDIGEKHQNKDEEIKQSMISEQQNDTVAPQQQFTVLSALCLPKVPLYVLAYALMKGCMYGLLFWLPTYLQEKGLAEEKGFISSMVDVGVFTGAIIIGYLGDKFVYKALFLSPFLFGGGAVMFIVGFGLKSQPWTYYIGMLAIGILVGGPYNLIGSVISLDIGEQMGKNNTGKISALMEGSAVFFAAISQIVIGLLPFTMIFYLFCFECLIAGAALIPLFLRDFKNWRGR